MSQISAQLRNSQPPGSSWESPLELLDKHLGHFASGRSEAPTLGEQRRLRLSLRMSDRFAHESDLSTASELAQLQNTANVLVSLESLAVVWFFSGRPAMTVCVAGC